jgi:hypothetical protein
MPYCTVGDVEAEIQRRFTSTSRPTDGDAASVIAGIAADLDGVLAAVGYNLPIASSEAIAILKRYTVYGAASALWHAMAQESTDSPRVVFWQTQYDAFLKRLRDGSQQLPLVEIPDDDNVAFAVAPAARRERYWLTGQRLKR